MSFTDAELLALDTRTLEIVFLNDFIIPTHYRCLERSVANTPVKFQNYHSSKPVLVAYRKTMPLTEYKFNTSLNCQYSPVTQVCLRNDDLSSAMPIIMIATESLERNSVLHCFNSPWLNMSYKFKFGQNLYWHRRSLEQHVKFLDSIAYFWDIWTRSIPIIYPCYHRM